jgi:hypothetical protein
VPIIFCSFYCFIEFFLADAWRNQVAFTAQSLQSSSFASGDPLLFSVIKYNLGNAYDKTTGRFTAPSSGLYMFIATSGSGGNFFLYVGDNTEISGAVSYSQSSSSVHGIMHLEAGQYVWVRSGGGSYWSHTSTFSGFLLAHDF